MRHIVHLFFVVAAATAWTFLTAAIAKPLHDHYGGVPFSLGDPDVWVLVTAVLLWCAAAFFLRRNPAVTLTAKIAVWAALAPMACLLFILSAAMRLPG